MRDRTFTAIGEVVHQRQRRHQFPVLGEMSFDRFGQLAGADALLEITAPLVEESLRVPVEAQEG